jgi:hypothetical protein
MKSRHDPIFKREAIDVSANSSLLSDTETRDESGRVFHDTASQSWTL